MLQFPVKILFMAFVLLGLGGAVCNSALTVLLPASETVLTIGAGLQFVGSFIISNFPLMIVITMVARRQDSSTPIYAAVMGYSVFLIASAFLSAQTYSSEFYHSVLGINVLMSEFNPLNETILYPFQTGIVAAVVVVWCARIAYRSTRYHSADGWLGYMDKDTMAVILTIIFCLVAGVVVTMLWPMMINIISVVMRKIASDITNPVNLFIYGVFDRLMSLFGLASISHNAFWFSNYGGSWMNQVGQNFFGDVNVWTAQQASLIVSNGAGRLITPYYLINFFEIPAVIIVTWGFYSNPNERKRYMSFMVIAIIVSIVFGTMLPFEIFLLITAPFILLIHLVTTGLLFGILQSIEVFIGHTYTGSVNYANPGNIIDLISYFNDTYTRGNLYMFLIVGGIVFVFYFLICYLYYNNLALDLINLGNRSIVDEFLKCIGGLGNVRNIHASTTKVTVKVINPSIVNLGRLHDAGVGKIVENKDGYSIYFGSDSVMIRKEVIKKIRGV